MRRSLLSLTGFVALSLACEREFRENHFTSEFSAGDNALLEARAAEQFPPNWTEEEEILHNSFSNIELETWASYYTHGDHIAGRNKSMAEETAKKWNANGVKSEIVEYEVFLNYPESQSLVLNLPNGTKHEAQMFEDKIEEDETTKDPKSAPAFLGYSASGEVEAEYVYCGLGHKDDFNELKAANVTLKGKIALIKYGGPFRGVKVRNAEANGMIGAVLFTDPGGDGPQEANGVKPYPDGPARHPSSIQRGSVAFIDKYIGDPTTPGYPSKPGAKRVTPSNLPKIPAVPISHRDAQPILKALDGHGRVLTRGGWVGGLKAKYNTGPAPGITLSLSNKMKDATTPIWNVIGIINGTNADETIIVGNHRDAWIIGGSADPNSGSAMMIEMTKAYGKLLATGWKPRRNIIFASWDAEEYALIGSTEWVEEHAPWLSKTALAYVNVDTAVTGDWPGAGATPEFREVSMQVMKKVVHRGNQTLYDTWYDQFRFSPEDNGFSYLGAASDYAPFLQLGIGAVDFGMDTGVFIKARNAAPVFHYHSNYDSHHWMRTKIDPDFSIHATCGQFLALLVHRLATNPLFDYNVYDLGRNVGYLYRDVTEYDILTAYQRLLKVTRRWDEQRGDIERNATRLEDANRKFKQIQRLFVSPEGLPGREFWKHILYAPNRDDGYKAVGFPFTREAIEDGRKADKEKWKTIAVKALNQTLEILNSI